MNRHIHAEDRTIYMVKLPRRAGVPQLWYNNKGYGKDGGQAYANVQANDFQHAQVFHRQSTATSAARRCGGTVVSFVIISYTDVP
jgi:hypothetical protein